MTHRAKLLFGQEADIIEEFERTLGKLVQKGDHFSAQLFEVVAQIMVVQNILPQPSPQFFNRVEPGGIGGQEEQGQVVVTGGLHDCRELVHRPIVLNQVNAFDGRINGSDLGIKLNQFLGSDLVALAKDNLAGQTIQDGGHPGFGAGGDGGERLTGRFGDASSNL